jgi:hypothetical protein
MLHRNDLRHHIIQKMGIAALGAALTWAILLSQTAAKMRDVTFNSTTQDVAFGPLVLTHITKTVNDNGTVTATFHFAQGLLWYLLIWLAVGAAIGYAVATFGGRKKRAQEVK